MSQLSDGPSPLRVAANRIAVALMLPLAGVISLIWTAVGILLTVDMLVFTGLSSVAVLTCLFLYLDQTNYHPPTNIFGGLVIFYALVLLIGAHEHRCRPYPSTLHLIAVETVLSLGCIFGLVLSVLSLESGVSEPKTGPGSPFSYRKAFHVSLAVMSAFLLARTLRVWRRASMEQLKELEARLFEAHVPGRYRQSVTAGLGTVDIHPPHTATRGGVCHRDESSECMASAASPVPLSSTPHGPAKPSAPVLVLLHGYGAGNGFWVLNIDALSKHFQVYCVELLGSGRSTRKTFQPKDPDDAERLFVDALEQWRAAKGLHAPFYLAGHSMGALVASNYAITYAKHVRHLLLLSPAGVPRPPPNRTEPARFQLSFWGLLRWGWTNGITPMSIVRYMGPLGAPFTAWVVRKRISWMPMGSAMRTRMNVDHLVQYVYQSWALPPSGEKALRHLLYPGAYAKTTPLIDRLPLSPPPNTGVALIYGSPDHDWMDPTHGEVLVRQLQERGVKAVHKVVHEAGHQVFLDNPEGFHEAFMEVIAELG